MQLDGGDASELPPLAPGEFGAQSRRSPASTMVSTPRPSRLVRRAHRRRGRGGRSPRRSTRVHERTRRRARQRVDERGGPALPRRVTRAPQAGYRGRLRESRVGAGALAAIDPAFLAREHDQQRRPRWRARSSAAWNSRRRCSQQVQVAAVSATATPLRPRAGSARPSWGLLFLAPSGLQREQRPGVHGSVPASPVRLGSYLVRPWTCVARPSVRAGRELKEAVRWGTMCLPSVVRAWPACTREKSPL
jgi:hypothetical protein